MMTSWRPFGLKERETLFTYKDGLLSAIIHPNTDKEEFTWITTLKDFELSGNRYLDNVKFKPVLLSDSDNIYNFAQEKAGIVLQKTNLLGNSDKIIFNPRTNRLTTIDKGGVSSSVQWGRGFQNEATNKLSEIISPKGEIIVKLEYDEEGRIVHKETGEIMEFNQYKTSMKTDRLSKACTILGKVFSRHSGFLGTAQQLVDLIPEKERNQFTAKTIGKTF